LLQQKKRKTSLIWAELKKILRFPYLFIFGVSNNPYGLIHMVPTTSHCLDHSLFKNNRITSSHGTVLSGFFLRGHTECFATSLNDAS